MAPRLTDYERMTVLEIVGELKPEERFLALDYLTVANRRRFRRGSPIDIGLEAELSLITPPVTMVVIWAFGVIKGEVRTILEERLRSIVRRIFRIEDPPLPKKSADQSIALGNFVSPRDLPALRTELTNYGVALGLEPQKAVLLAELAVNKVLEASR